MLKVERIIITLIVGKHTSIDLELPAFLPISELADKILETLKILYSREFECVSDIFLTMQGQPLDEQKTLASLGVWDGSTLEVNRR